MPVIPLWSTSVVAKVEEVETWSRYDVAPLAALHSSETDVLIPVAAFAGANWTGTDGAEGAAAVVNILDAENPLEPATFVALTRQ